MKTHTPQASILLIKSLKRQELGAGKPAAKDRLSDLRSIDLTPFLLTDGASLSVSKSVRQPAGEFALTVPDRPANVPSGGKSVAETLYGIVEPMDFIEIRLAANPDKENMPKKNTPWVVMRGFVTQVSRSESMQGGEPRRTVSITGHDYGKILQIIQLYYLFGTPIGAYFQDELKFFQKFATENEAKIKLLTDFFQSLTTNVLNPFLGKLTQLAVPPKGAAIIKEFRPKCTVIGATSPWYISGFQDVSVYDLLKSICDVGPFNELYTMDREDGIDLVLRPAPLLSINGTQIQGEKPETATVDSADIESIQVSRSDESVANFYWVRSSIVEQLRVDELTLALSGAELPVSTWDTEAYVNTEAKYYGYRKMEVQSNIAPPELAATDAPSQQTAQDETLRLGTWLAHRRKLLADLNKDSLVLESGRISMAGKPTLKAGTQLTVTRGNKRESFDCYAHTVAHEFQPFTGNFRTIVTFDRGTGWVKRASPGTPKYRAETDAQGIT